jgi:hypothetical protein
MAEIIDKILNIEKSTLDKAKSTLFLYLIP